MMAGRLRNQFSFCAGDADDLAGKPAAVAGAAWDGWLFRVALRSQPVDAAGSRQPLIDLSFALEPLDVPNIGARAVSLDLPVALFDALHLEDDPRRFGFRHIRNMSRIGPNG
jgi:hypothetical protein